MKCCELKLLELFRFVAEKVPAYKDFLRQYKIKPEDVHTLEDLRRVPPMDKNNYLRKYPLVELCIDGTLDAQLVFTSTSGSTGEPYFFPRGDALDDQFSRYCELLFENSTGAGKSTLIIVGFGMGMWIGGLITYEAFKHIGDRGNSLSIVTPGTSCKEIYDAMRNIAPHYDRVILCGYPPFIKDVIDDGKAHGVDWKKHDMKLLFAAESFSEKFRDYLVEKAHVRDPLRDTMNTYGSAELGGMAVETPIAILIRRMALENKEIYERLFTDASRLPTLAQYDPNFIHFEAQDKNVLVSGMNTLPLVRYAIGDNGDVWGLKDIEGIFKEEGVDLRAEAKQAGISDTIRELPFVYIHERTDLSTKLYGATIYPEYIKAGLEHPDLEDLITGKFTMLTEHDQKQDEYLEVNVELAVGIQPNDRLYEKVMDAIYNALAERSAEYRYMTGTIKERIIPRVRLWPHEYPPFFKTGGKQKWVKKHFD